MIINSCNAISYLFLMHLLESAVINQKHYAEQSFYFQWSTVMMLYLNLHINKQNKWGKRIKDFLFVVTVTHVHDDGKDDTIWGRAFNQTWCSQSRIRKGKEFPIWDERQWEQLKFEYTTLLIFRPFLLSKNLMLFMWGSMI